MYSEFAHDFYTQTYILECLESRYSVVLDIYDRPKHGFFGEGSLQ